MNMTSLEPATQELLNDIQEGNKKNIYDFYEKFKIDEFTFIKKNNYLEDDFITDLSSLDDETLLLLHESSNWVSPSYFLRRRMFDSYQNIDDRLLNVFVQCLSPNATNELFNRYIDDFTNASDEALVLFSQKENEDALEVLIERYRPYVSKVIKRLEKKFFFRGFETDDLFQEGILGLFKSKDDFKVERKTRFKDFSKYVIEKHIGTLILRSSNYKNKVLNESFSYHSPIGSESEVTFEQLLKSESYKPEDTYVNKETFEAIWDKLTDLEQNVLLLYSKGLSYEEIGELVGKQKKAIDNTIQRIRKKGKLYMSNFKQ